MTPLPAIDPCCCPLCGQPNACAMATPQTAAEAVVAHGADVGICLDGDADRVFVVDEQGRGLSGSTTTAILAAAVLRANPGATVLHNLICSRSVSEVIAENGGVPVRTKVGHSNIKQVMAETGAVFGGEHSAHYYFLDNYRADSGIIATMFMLVAIVSGIITHKKIFKDFFTFRSGKGQRSWLDAHNATAVFALPFHLMITFSGLLLLMFMFMPWGINQAYENRQQFLRDQQASMIEQPQKAEDVPREGERTARGERGQQRGEHAQGRGKERLPQPELRPAPLTDLAPIMVAVQQQWKDNPIASINIISPNTDQAKIELRALRAESVAHRNVYATLNYNGVTGQDETDKNLRIKNPSIPSGIYNVVTVLHEARGLDLALRWLLFCSGILGTLMVATGLILWCVKRAPQQQKQGYKSFGFRLVEVLNIAAIIGLPLACAAYFYANRFIPADVEMRLNWEIRSFFTVWLLTLIYAIFRNHRQAWLDLLLLATLAFALLPVVNLMTGGQALWNSIAQGQWMIASVDLAMWVMAVIFYFAYDKVKKHQGLPNKKVKAPVQEAEA